MEIQSGSGVSKTDEAIARELDNAISTPVINSIGTITINDDGGLSVRAVTTVTGTNINEGAVFSIVADPTTGRLTINSSTGVLTWQGNEGEDDSYVITVKVVNPDGGTDTETFTLNVTDSL